MKKFRFDSYAFEFAGTASTSPEIVDIKTEVVDIKPEILSTSAIVSTTALDVTGDNDSGIDSEETVSPPVNRLLEVTRTQPQMSPEDDQPLSLVLREQPHNLEALSATKARTPSVKRHWKKFLKDQAFTPKPDSPAKRSRFLSPMTSQEVQEEAENLCINDLKRKSTESTVAQALLSLGMATSDRHLMSPLQQQQQPHSSHTILARQTFSSLENASQCSLASLQSSPSSFIYPNFLSPQMNKPTSSFLAPLKELRTNGQQLLSQPTFHQDTTGDAFRLSRLLLPPSACLPEHRDQNLMPPPASSMSTNAEARARKPYFCCECKKGFSTHSGFVKHEELHRSNQIQKSFTCKFCSKGYTSLSALKMHTRTHTLPCKCHICGKSFSRPWLLQGHVRTHTGEKPFSCHYCSRSFADKSNLRAHLQTHLQLKKYSCSRCQKTFSRMSLLNKHSETGCQSSNKLRTGDVMTSGGYVSGVPIRT